MTEFQKLLDLLDRELSVQEDLLKLLTRERAAIVKLNSEETAALAEEKSALLEKATLSEQKLQSAFGEGKLSEIIAQCEETKLKKQLEAKRSALKEVASRVKELNDLNSQLLQQALGFVSSTFSIVRSAQTPEPATYGRKGKLASEGPVIHRGRSA
jgi:flagellar biosynthesis/type III secretory pathway chaperone